MFKSVLSVYPEEKEKWYDYKIIEEIFPLENKMNLYYLFDFGDSWMFKINKSRKKPHEPEENVKYPRLVNEIGEKPEQYPSYDDEW